MTPATIRLFDREGNLLAALEAHIPDDDPREVRWEHDKVLRDGLYHHAELDINGVPRGEFKMKFHPRRFYKGSILLPWCRLRFKQPLVLATASLAAPRPESPSARS